MKKTINIFLFMVLGLAYSSFAQSAQPADFFAGKWEITVLGTPNGDAKLVADLIRKDNKLTGQLSNPADPNAEKIAITSIEEKEDKMGLSFTAQGYDVTLELAKVDNDNLKGMLMNMFEAKGVRLKE